MKRVLFLVLVAALASCGNGSSDKTNTDSVIVDTSLSGPVITTDTAGARILNADTTGMGQAR